jgi:AraC-like DNA-binding protein
MTGNSPIRVKTISEFHRLRGLPQPEHPLISVIEHAALKYSPDENSLTGIFGFYSVSIKRGVVGKLKYGQQEYDFDEGIMYFTAPNQLFRVEVNADEKTPKPTGWILLIHPDFIWNTALAKKIQQYEYFGYSVNEALFLSEKEEAMINNIIDNIRQEYHSRIDKHSQSIIVSQLETLFNYSERFYQRQFITRKISSHQVLDRLEGLLAGYFNSDDLAVKGLPTVRFIADTLNISASYLSGLLKVLTGQSTQQHIHNKLIEKAKEKLSTTGLSVSEIAYELGFEHSQSFNRLFKSKTKLSPLEFRQSFN